MRKKRTRRDRRLADCFQLLEMLSRRSLPAEYLAPEDVHRILALRSAMLIEALTASLTYSRTREPRIARAVVTAVTADGRKALAERPRSARAWAEATEPTAQVTLT